MPTNFSYYVPASGKSKSGVTSVKSLTGAVAGFKGGKLSPSVNVGKYRIVAAALEVGYGPRANWGSSQLYSIPSSPERRQLGRYLAGRALSMLNLFDLSNGELVVSDFVRHLDQSDRTSVNFVIGQIFAAPAIKQWLGKKPARIIHASHLKQALIRSANSERIPDFLVEDQDGGWHALEAKAGEDWSTPIKNALEQLNALNGFRDGQVVHSINCRVASFAEVPVPGKAVSVRVVDPPGDGVRAEEGLPCLLVDLAEAIQFMLVARVLRSLPAVRPQDRFVQPEDATWRGVGTSSVHVLVPRCTKELNDLSWRVEVLLAAIRQPDLMLLLFYGAPAAFRYRSRGAIVHDFLSKAGISARAAIDVLGDFASGG